MSDEQRERKRLEGDRFYVQLDKHHLFQAWGKDDERSAFPTLKDVFVFAAAVGWAQRRRIPLKGRQHVGFWRAFTPQEDVPLLQAIAIAETGDPAGAADHAMVLEIAEQYANGGIDVINDYERSDLSATVVALASLVSDAAAVNG
jgi:dnd system-associated protein 4